MTFLLQVREAAKKSYFLSGPATKAFTPPPLGLVAIGFFFHLKIAENGFRQKKILHNFWAKRAIYIFFF